MLMPKRVKHRKVQRGRMKRGVLAMMAAAQGDLARQHLAQLRSRHRIAFEIVHCRALEIVRGNAPRHTNGARAPASLIHHASRPRASAARP